MCIRDRSNTLRRYLVTQTKCTLSLETLCLPLRKSCMLRTDRYRVAAVILVYRYRVKSLNGLLDKQARAVSYVFNFCNDTQKHALKWGKRWPTGFDLNKLTAG